MPAYNAGETIRDSINSILLQSFDNWELIVCDDNSSDDTYDIVSSFKDERIKIISNEYAKGAAGARNWAIDNSRGRFIAFLDSDDLWTELKLERQIDFMLKNNVSFSFGDYNVINEHECKTGLFKAPDYADFNSLLKSCGIGCLTVMLDKTIVKNIVFPHFYKEDYFLWLNILKEYNIVAYNMGFVCATYRLSSKSLSSNKIKEISRQWNVLGKFVDGFFCKGYYLSCYIISGLKKHFLDYKFGKS